MRNKAKRLDTLQMVATGIMICNGRHNSPWQSGATHAERAKCLAQAKANSLAGFKEGDLLDERCLRFRCLLELRFFPR